MIIVEVGNTRVKLAILEEEAIRSVERYPTREETTLIARITELSAHHTTAILAASGTVPDELGAALALFSLTQMRNGMPVDLPSRYSSMSTLGVDRLANAVMAAREYPSHAALVIDVGTCVTYDLTVGGEYYGGAISPGLFMRAKAMHHFTAALPEVEPPAECLVVGDSTTASLHSGVLHGWRAEIEGMLERFAASHKELKVIVTGGDLAYFEAGTKSRIFADPFWTLKGYHQIYRLHAR